MPTYKVEIEFETGLTENAVRSIIEDMIGPGDKVVDVEKNE